MSVKDNMYSGRTEHPDLEKHDRAETGGLNSWIVRYPLRAPVIGLTIAGILFAILYFTGAVGGPLLLVGAFIAVISLFLLVYGLIRKAVDISVGRIQKAAPYPAEPTETGRLTRQEALSRWTSQTRG